MAEPDLDDAEKVELRAMLAERRAAVAAAAADAAKAAAVATAQADLEAEQQKMRDAAAILEAPIVVARASLDADLLTIAAIVNPTERQRQYDARVAAYDAEVAKVHSSQEWIDLHAQGDAVVQSKADAVDAARKG